MTLIAILSLNQCRCNLRLLKLILLLLLSCVKTMEQCGEFTLWCDRVLNILTNTVFQEVPIFKYFSILLRCRGPLYRVTLCL